MSRKSQSINKSISLRKQRIEGDLRRLADVQTLFLRPQIFGDANPFPKATLSGVARIRKTQYYLHVWEELRFPNEEAVLYGFTYSVKNAESQSLFRYECHPEVEDAVDDTNETWKNQYTVVPHFHPDNLVEPLDRLHFIFHRSERPRVVFALIKWLEADLVKRFYDSGRMASV